MTEHTDRLAEIRAALRSPNLIGTQYSEECRGRSAHPHRHPPARCGRARRAGGAHRGEEATVSEVKPPFDMKTDMGKDGTFPFVEDEDDNIHGYGHQDKATFAAKVNAYDAACNGEAFPEDEQWGAWDIAHKWAVADPDGERFWVNVPATEERVEHLLPPGPVGENTPGAFPITTLWGQR